MNGKTSSDFTTELYNNPEMEFVYNEEHYMLSGYVESDDKLYTLELWNITQNKSLFKESNAFREKCVKSFEDAKIFDGKTIYEVEDEITVLYG
jgi:hypothetical protein